MGYRALKRQLNLLYRLSMFALLLALVVIVLGAWVRLSDAGLGCPDWPGCYGHISWPDQADEISVAQQNYPDRPVETDKAWKEVIHRYFAGVLGLVVFALAWLTWRMRRRFSGLPVKTALLLVPLIMLQALFGMWTVTLKLLPWVVTTHLLGGMLTFTLLFWANRSLKHARREHLSNDPSDAYLKLRPWIIVGLVMLTAQIVLGGWTSSNYAALACLDFPTCQQQWWPDTNFSEAFVLWREIGVDYEGGVLDQAARNAIHITHRIGAAIVLLVIGWLAARLIGNPLTRSHGLLITALLGSQIILGIQNVLLKLPLINAVAHNGVAALLLVSVVNALWWSQRSSTERQR